RRQLQALAIGDVEAADVGNLHGHGVRKPGPALASRLRKPLLESQSEPFFRPVLVPTQARRRGRHRSGHGSVGAAVAGRGDAGGAGGTSERCRVLHAGAGSLCGPGSGYAVGGDHQRLTRTARLPPTVRR
ncbi:MAG: hypothetical protein ACK5X3_11730, partial [Pseudomonadota bacterium]